MLMKARTTTFIPAHRLLDRLPHDHRLPGLSAEVSPEESDPCEPVQKKTEFSRMQVYE
jgi:hypothetical protein